ncbi:hypothetical protein INT43_003844 [Umbelopsis isabellina]|uniref:Uncharacterized protein n=1 Tax=Mortierella isabellina TaxID=91625 RepID=A0A8H7PTI0_MORIS|nr:hypothetical protein INT43_003844 [Umbelopsis isabellina]
MQDISDRRESFSTFRSKQETTSPTSGDTAVSQLLGKLEEAGQTIANLRSILTFKTAELNELVGQLEITNQAIENVETTTVNIETMLTEMGLSSDTFENHTRESMLLDAQASLDHALKFANTLYTTEQDHSGTKLTRRRSMASSSSGGLHSDNGERRDRTSANYSVSKIRYKPDAKPILRKLHELIRQLELDSAKFFQDIGSTDDLQKLQKAYVNLEIAKTIALAAKTNFKRRTIILRRARRRDAMEEIDLLGIKIREAVAIWQEHTMYQPLKVDGKDILDILDREDDLIAKNVLCTTQLSLPVYKRMSIDISARNSPTPSTSGSVRRLKSTSSTGSNGSAPSTPTKLTTAIPQLDVPDNSSLSLHHIPPQRFATISGGTKTKTFHRHSTGNTVRPVAVKPVTSSASTMLPRAPLVIKPSVNNNKKEGPDGRPLAVISNNATNTIATVENDSRKESKLQKPSYMGPGSTMRLRDIIMPAVTLRSPPHVAVQQDFGQMEAIPSRFL